ncbi:heterokaryon incompatibility protein-domain-containing protein [Xylariales sp. PMI_506]|nr:heterokaryon incompatibility protein-domain-containing protein [Xylariales sp. PMI_506]
MYHPLDKAGREFRLLRLHPGATPDPIKADLITSSLRDHEPFEALSYVWGDTKNEEPISLAGKSTLVTRNLYEALDKMRRDSEPRLLWVDALCINQEDVDERSHQVRLMRDIYGRATCVLAWLGGGPDAADTVRVMQLIGSDRDIHWTDDRIKGDDLLSIFSFLCHEWWYRIWTAQEAAVAQSLVFVYDNHEVLDETVNEVSLSYVKHCGIRSCCDYEAKWPEVITMNIASFLPNRFLAWRRLRELQQKLRGPTPAELSLSTVASLFRIRRAMNARDKIYGVLGFVSDLQTSWVDYKLSIEATYETAARECIKASKRLDMLSHAFYDTGVDHYFPRRGDARSRDRAESVRRSKPSLPSWVPDWSTEFGIADAVEPVLDFRITFLQRWKSCGNYEALTSSDDPPGSLGVLGLFVDTIEVVGTPRFDPHRGDMDAFHDWRAIAGVDKDPMATYKDGTTRLDAYWKTLCLDMSAIDSLAGNDVVPRASDQDRAEHDEWWFAQLVEKYRLKNPHGEQRHLEQYFPQQVEMATMGRAFFVSRKGYFGLAPTGALAGDRVCILAGGRPPFILRYLREVSVLGKDSAPGFTLIGDSYVHGIMDGEAAQGVDDGTTPPLEKWYLI